MPIDIANLLPWSDVETVPSVHGPRGLRKAAPTPAFWNLWRTRTSELKPNGVQPTRIGDQWVIFWWQPISDTTRTASNVDAGRPGGSALGVSRPQSPDVGGEGERAAVVSAISPDILAKLRDYQHAPASALAAGFDRYPFILDGSDMGAGKAQPIDSPVLTPYGWKAMGDIRVGDSVIGKDGSPTRVIAVHPQGFKECYRVTFSDGSWAECCDDHLWQVTTPVRKYRSHPSLVKSTRALRSDLTQSRAGNAKWFIPMVSPVKFSPQVLPLSPYALGVILGDGGITQCGITLTTADLFIAQELTVLLPKTVEVVKHASNKYGYQIRARDGRRVNDVTVALRAMGLLGKRSERKFVPTEYLLGTPEQRLSLLQGLMDTDGSVCRNGTFEFSSTSKRLVEDVVFIVQSLGGKTSEIANRQTYCTHKGTKRAGLPSYRIHFSLPFGWEPFRLPRKRDRIRRQHKYNPTRAIVSITPIGARLCQCITVAAPDGLYVTQSFIVTHNSYTAMAVTAARGLKPVIICRKAAFGAWKKVAAYFGYPDPIVSNYELIRMGTSPLGRWIKKTFKGKKRPTEIFEWTLPAGSMLVLDEIHWCTGNRTQNSDLLMAAAYQRITTIGLSATAADSPLKLRALGYALGLHHGRDFDLWAAAHGCEKGKFGLEFNCGISRGRLYEYDGKDDSGKPKFRVRPEVQAELDEKRRQVMMKIHRDIFGTGRGVRIRINDVPGFPEVEVQPHIMDFDTTDEIKRAYADLLFELEGLYKHADRMAAMRKAHKKIELLKVELVAQEVNDLVEQGYSVPVFTNFTDSLMKMRELCKTDCCVYGGQNADERQRSLDAFQENKQHVIILNNQAGGESIGLHDLLGERQRISYVFPTFWANAFRQVFGRTRRDGAKSKSLIRIAFAADTVEEDAYESTLKKCNRIDTLNDGDLAPFIPVTV